MTAAVLAGNVKIEVAGTVVLDGADAQTFAGELVDDLFEQEGLAGIVVAGERYHGCAQVDHGASLLIRNPSALCARRRKGLTCL